jgi:hypothetical protein
MHLFRSLKKQTNNKKQIEKNIIQWEKIPLIFFIKLLDYFNVDELLEFKLVCKDWKKSIQDIEKDNMQYISIYYKTWKEYINKTLLSKCIEEERNLITYDILNYPNNLKSIIHFENTNLIGLFNDESFKIGSIKFYENSLIAFWKSSDNKKPEWIEKLSFEKSKYFILLSTNFQTSPYEINCFQDGMKEFIRINHETGDVIGKIKFNDNIPDKFFCTKEFCFFIFTNSKREQNEIDSGIGSMRLFWILNSQWDFDTKLIDEQVLTFGNLKLNENLLFLEKKNGNVEILNMIKKMIFKFDFKLNHFTFNEIEIPKDFVKIGPIILFESFIWIKINKNGIYFWDLNDKKQFQSEILILSNENHPYFKNNINQICIKENMITFDILKTQYVFDLHLGLNEIYIQFYKLIDKQALKDDFYFYLNEFDYKNRKESKKIYNYQLYHLDENDLENINDKKYLEKYSIFDELKIFKNLLIRKMKRIVITNNGIIFLQENNLNQNGERKSDNLKFMTIDLKSLHNNQKIHSLPKEFIRIN